MQEDQNLNSFNFNKGFTIVLNIESQLSKYVYIIIGQTRVMKERKKSRENGEKVEIIEVIGH